ncbi:MAG: hypothetical protein ACXVP5_09290 [Tumebacillaceae bacterium]|jgi:hypothetical protein
MSHEEVLKSFYARLKGVATESMIRVIDLAQEHGLTYRQLRNLLQSSGLEPFWIGGKAFIFRDDAANVLVQAS